MAAPHTNCFDIVVLQEEAIPWPPTNRIDHKNVSL
jgi:hypothetical protein